MSKVEDRTIRILIADDHGVVREGLRAVLEREGLEVVGEAVDGRQAVALAVELAPDVVLLDIRMPELNGLEALKRIKKQAPEIKVLMLTTYATPEYLTRAIRSGADGYLSKEADPEELPSVVRAAVNKPHLINRELLCKALALADAIPARTGVVESADNLPLSARELEVLRLIVAGYSNDAIAETLTISIPTVKTHVRHIFERLGVSDRTQAAVWAVRHGIE